MNHALNPEVQTSVSKLPLPEYEAYIGLQRLSRRSRYLVNEKDNNVSSVNGFLTHEKHLGRAIRHLDKLIEYFNAKYTLNIKPISFTCVELTQTDQLKHVIIT